MLRTAMRRDRRNIAPMQVPVKRGDINRVVSHVDEIFPCVERWWEKWRFFRILQMSRHGLGDNEPAGNDAGSHDARVLCVISKSMQNRLTSKIGIERHFIKVKSIIKIILLNYCNLHCWSEHGWVRPRCSNLSVLMKGRKIMSRMRIPMILTGKHLQQHRR